MKRGRADKTDILAVARAADVSPATVSRAFNHPELVKAPTRKRIETVVERLGYIRNRAARTIHGRRSGTIGLLVPTMTNSIFSELTQAISEEVEEEGFTILMATHGYDLQREVVLLRKFLEHRVDGVALIGLDHHDAVYTLIERQKVPTVSVWNYDPHSRVSCVGADNAVAGEVRGTASRRAGASRDGPRLSADDGQRTRPQQTRRRDEGAEGSRNSHLG